MTSVQRDFPVAQLLFLAVLFLLGTLTIDNFTSPYSMRAMLILSALLGISALGQTVCLLVGGLDVSIPGWILAGSTVTVQLIGNPNSGWSAWETFLVLGVGAVLVGGASGLISYYFRVPSLVITLAVGAMVTGGVFAWSEGNINGIPPQWIANATSPATKTFGIGLPPIVFIWLIIALAAWLVLQRSVIGPWVYATGNNRRAAELAIIPTHWVWFGAFALSAIAATTAGVLLSGFAAGGDASVGTPYLWNGLTAVLIGGTAFGTRGDYTRTVIGALIVVVLGQDMTGWGFSYQDQNILYGALIILVVSLYRRDRRLRDQI
ncbi:MAG TPA: ABC transporter permease [Gaiellaceae bacterium]|nr:ABC transporter permease [Gaiellaceae bacterium]